jgi:septal ring factor EnvC (AmiA/AmiB activator)
MKNVLVQLVAEIRLAVFSNECTAVEDASQATASLRQLPFFIIAERLSHEKLELTRQLEESESHAASLTLQLKELYATMDTNSSEINRLQQRCSDLERIDVERERTKFLLVQNTDAIKAGLTQNILTLHRYS